MSIMIERLEGMVNRYHEITELMMQPDIVSDSRELAKLGREQADLTQVVETYQDYKHSMEALEEAKELLKEEDKEIKEMAKMEIEELEPKIEEYLGKLEILLIPKDPNDSHNAIVEIRGAAMRAISLRVICIVCIASMRKVRAGRLKLLKWMTVRPAVSLWYPSW